MASKDKGFVEGLAAVTSIVVYLLLLYTALNWLKQSTGKERLLLLVVFSVLGLFYLWGTTLM
jgi:hypothetical protein